MPTFADAAEKWLIAYSKLGQLRASTVALYSHNLRAYAVPRFGTKAVTAVTREDIRALVVDLVGQGKSRSLVRNVIAPVRQTFNQRVDDGVISANPAVRIGRYLKDKSDPRRRIEPAPRRKRGYWIAY